MSNTWTDEEIGELVRLWSSHSAEQIGRRLHRPTGAISGKASRLRKVGVLPFGGVAKKKYDLHPWPTLSRVAQKRHLKSAPAKPERPKKTGSKSDPVLPSLDDALDEMRPCTLVELDDTRCHWPLGDVEMIAVRYCGAPAALGRRYCGHHWLRAHGKVA
jgi:GcrA cell cycle regulator